MHPASWRVVDWSSEFLFARKAGLWWVTVLTFILSAHRQAKLQLDEDALVLWQSLLRNSQTLDPRLAALVPAAVEQLQNDRDQLSKGLAIIDSYILLDGPKVYEVSGSLSATLSVQL